MSTFTLSLGSDALSEDDLLSLSQKSNLSQFQYDEDTDLDYENEHEEENPSSEEFSSQEFSQVDHPISSSGFENPFIKILWNNINPIKIDFGK